MLSLIKDNSVCMSQLANISPPARKHLYDLSLGGGGGGGGVSSPLRRTKGP